MSIFKLAMGVLIDVVFYGAVLFVPAGTLHWWRAWVIVGAIFACAVATIVGLARVNMDLIKERWKPPIQKGQPLVDKIIVLALLTTYVGSMVFIPLDVFRFHLLPPPGPIVSWLGLVLFLVGWWMMTLALRENAFASPVVKHMEERRQKVIDTGVYSVVRHPMYAAAIPLFVGMPLWLESYAAALLTILPIATLIVRIHFEERFLRIRLEGYEAYTHRVRYRLIPYLF